MHWRSRDAACRPLPATWLLCRMWLNYAGVVKARKNSSSRRAHPQSTLAARIGAAMPTEVTVPAGYIAVADVPQQIRTLCKGVMNPRMIWCSFERGSLWSTATSSFISHSSITQGEVCIRDIRLRPADVAECGAC